MATLIDGTLKLVVLPEQTSTSQPIENCNANTVTGNVSADTSGLFFCPVVNREVGIKDLVCQFSCDQRRRV